MSNYELGLHIAGFQSSAAIFENDKIKFAIAEERLIRQKRSNNFPIQSIKLCLKRLEIKSLSSIDKIIVNWNPTVSMKNINRSGFTFRRRYDPELLYTIPNNLSDFFFNEDDSSSTLYFSKKKNIEFLKHHLSHLGWIFTSPFEECAFAIIDEHGESDTIFLGKFSENRLSKLKTTIFPNSLGIFYSTFTEFLGMRAYSDEWKVMGAAAYGDARRFEQKLRNLIHFSDGKIFLDSNYFTYGDTRFKGYYNEKLIDLIGIKPRLANTKISQDFFDLAASTQSIFEENLFKILRYLYKKTKSKNLFYNGGCAMNSLANGKILENTDFQDLHISFAPSDLGCSIGSVLYQKGIKKKKLWRLPVTPYLGPSFSQKEVKDLLESNKIKYKIQKNFVQNVAQLISKNKIGAWFHGSMEFGERALGNRSIIADPRDANVKEKINKLIKFREFYRPLAPAVKIESVENIFNSNTKSEFMESAVKVNKSWKNKIKGVIHEDHTSRIQVVSKKTNPLFWKLIDEFEKITSTPLIVNTSFNLNYEPIVCSPKDAISSFFNSGLDFLCIEGILIEK